MPRFVLLYHECPPGYERPSHWDLMLEAGESLRTWALVELPQGWQAAQAHTGLSHPDCRPVAARHSVDAEALGDHRREYLNYEGPISEDRGSVTRIDAGTFTTTAESSHSWQIELAGRHLRGAITLTQSAVDAAKWKLSCRE